MPDTADHRADMYQLARARVRAGKPVWDEEVIRIGDVFHNEDMTFIERRDAIVAALVASRWYRNGDPHDWEGVIEIVDNLAVENAVEDFDYWWGLLYDVADADRVFIDTISRSR